MSCKTYQLNFSKKGEGLFIYFIFDGKNIRD